MTLSFATLLVVLFFLCTEINGFSPKWGNTHIQSKIFQQSDVFIDGKDRVVIDGNYNVALGFGAVSALLFSKGLLLPGIPFAALTALLAKQTGRVKFTFDDRAMEVFIANEDGTFGSRENFAVGGKNRWDYSTFLKWSFIPSKDVPIFMYFTESQTDPKKAGGQFHLFPVIMDSKQLYDQLMLRVGEK